MRRRCAAAAVVMAVLSGCGGSGRLSSSDLTNQASQICSQANHQITRIKTPAQPAGAQAFLRQGISALTPELAQLRKLRPPADEQDVYTATINASEKKLALLRTAAGSITAGQDPVSTLQTLEQQLAPVVQQENGGWRALGIPACVSQ